MPRPIRSRRDRPAKRPLSREWIVAETIKIIRDEGLEKATLRRVAQSLDTGAASLYVYIANTAELHAAVLDELLDSLEEPEADSWHDQVVELLSAYAEVLFTYPGLARSALVLPPTGPNALLLYERLMGRLIDGGVGVGQAAWGAELLMQYVTGTAAEHSVPTPSQIDAPDDPAGKWAQLTRSVRAADAAATPRVAEHAEVVLAGSPRQRFTWAIAVLLTGIAAVPIPTASPSKL